MTEQSADQVTLTGDEAEADRERPGTMRTCLHCDEMVLRSRWDEHRQHDESLRDSRQQQTNRTTAKSEESDDEDEPREVGAVYDITLSYSVDYRLRVTAMNEHQAKEKAREDVDWTEHPTDAMHVHTDKRKVKTVYEDDPEAEDIVGDW